MSARWNHPRPRRAEWILVRIGEILLNGFDGLRDLLWLTILGPEGMAHERRWREIERSRRGRRHLERAQIRRLHRESDR